MATCKFISSLVLSYMLLIVKTQNQSLYINYLNCTISEKFIFPNVTCSAKSYNRSYSGLNIVGTSRMALNSISVNWNEIVRSRDDHNSNFRETSSCFTDTEMSTAKWFTHPSSMYAMLLAKELKTKSSSSWSISLTIPI